MKTFKFFSIILFLTISAFGQAQQVIPVNSTDIAALIKKEKTLKIIDVRTVGEYNQGHLQNAILMDISQQDAFNQYDKLDKNAKYLIYCRTKNRSGVVSNYLISKGFKVVYQMVDGIVGWNANNLPTIK